MDLSASIFLLRAGQVNADPPALSVCAVIGRGLRQVMLFMVVRIA